MKSCDVISPVVRAEILTRIEKAEREHNVRVLYAVESGSRAWGFASKNSDYDVRFIYAHHQDWYLSIDVEDKRDVIEYPIVDEIDINGWDVRKALRLYRKSNPALIEWLQSPIVYRCDDKFAPEARELMEHIFSPQKSIYHYLHMARGNYRSYLKKAQVPLKKYLYVLRPLLAIRWIEKFSQPAPIEFERLRKMIDDSLLNKEIDCLLERKRNSTEKEMVLTITVLNRFIESELQRLETYKQKPIAQGNSTHVLSELLRSSLLVV